MRADPLAFPGFFQQIGATGSAVGASTRGLDLGRGLQTRPFFQEDRQHVLTQLVCLILKILECLATQRLGLVGRNDPIQGFGKELQ